MPFWRASLGALLGIGLFSLNVQAQQPTEPKQRRQLPAGVTQEYVLEVFAWDFQPSDSLTTTGFTIIPPAVALRYLKTGINLLAAVHLPSGAIIDVIELDACDTSATNNGTVDLVQLTDGGGGPGGSTNIGSATITAGAGCTYIDSATIGVTVDNFLNEYVLSTMWPAGDASVGLRGVKVYYSLQVSPPPLTQDFGDVPPSSPQFQFIEALFQSGITAGCGGGNYCPNNPVTRGQMAVFIAKALGLNWPD